MLESGVDIEATGGNVVTTSTTARITLIDSAVYEAIIAILLHVHTCYELLSPMIIKN